MKNQARQNTVRRNTLAIIRIPITAIQAQGPRMEESHLRIHETKTA